MFAPESSLPPILLSQDEADRLWALAMGSRLAPDVAEFLESELDRAEVVAESDLPNDVVRMGSHVTYRDEESNTETSATLVFPGEENLEERRISILSPVGAALIGLRAGQSIAFTTRNGRRRKLSILSVSRPETVA